MSQRHEVFAEMDPRWWNPTDVGDERRYTWAACDAWIVKELARLRAARPDPLRTPSWSVLDAGCGRGRTTSRLLDAGFKVTALDVNERMLEFVRRLPVQQTVLGSVMDLPMWMAGCFDVALSVFVVEHLPSLRGQIAELRLATRPGGLVVATVTQRHSAYALWTTKLNPALRRRQADWPKTQYSWRQLQEELELAGLELVAARGFGTVAPLSLRPGWKGLLVSGKTADRWNRRLDPWVGLQLGHVVAAIARCP